jgi:nitroimidazol reductase NimA-like FMN-containing flavoprotein (pyridoxamine 5'-phosphate oxidase superfamily)
MKPEVRDSIVEILSHHRLMTMATVRADGWPQATVVSYVHEGLALFCFVSRLGQKFANIKRDSRISVAIAGDFSGPANIKGLSLAARASVVEERLEFDTISALFMQRFPEYTDWPRPNPAFAPLLRVTPEVISVIDYSKGFGHSDLVTVTKHDVEPHIETRRQSWLAHILGG